MKTALSVAAWAKKGHRRAELEIVGKAEDVAGRAALDRVHQLRASAQSGPQRRVSEIGRGFGKRGNRVALGDGTPAEPPELREDEPHPVALFMPATQFLADPSKIGSCAATKRCR
jgi:hypothetical protein